MFFCTERNLSFISQSEFLVFLARAHSTQYLGADFRVSARFNQVETSFAYRAIPSEAGELLAETWTSEKLKLASGTVVAQGCVFRVVMGEMGQRDFVELEISIQKKDSTDVLGMKTLVILDPSKAVSQFIPVYFRIAEVVVTLELVIVGIPWICQDVQLSRQCLVDLGHVAEILGIEHDKVENNLFLFWQAILLEISENHELLLSELRKRYWDKLSLIYRRVVISDIVGDKLIRKELASNARSRLDNSFKSSLRVLPKEQWSSPLIDGVPVLYVESPIEKFKLARNPGSLVQETFHSACHVVVFLHGLYGSSYDHQFLRASFTQRFPETEILASQANEAASDDDISIQGKLLADEIFRFLQVKRIQRAKFSFICFSLGGLVGRASLPYLKDHQLSTFLTLSSPHLGFTGSKSRLVDTGLFLFKKFSSTAGKAMDQLTLSDDKDILNCFLVQLAEAKGLERFQNVVLFSSLQDTYSPSASSRIESTSSITEIMAHNLLRSIKTEKLMRVDVNFQLSGKRDLDSFTGRAAHLQFIENEVFAEILASYFGYLFSN
jgi:Putative serine esterase (DUF676)